MIRRIHHTRGRVVVAILAGVAALFAGGRLYAGADGDEASSDSPHLLAGRRLFEKETFGGNGRTCLTCHSAKTGTVSPDDARARFLANPHDPLFLGDGSDDGAGNGAERMLTQATVLVKVPLADNVTLAADPNATAAVLRRGDGSLQEVLRNRDRPDVRWGSGDRSDGAGSERHRRVPQASPLTGITSVLRHPAAVIDRRRQR